MLRDEESKTESVSVTVPFPPGYTVWDQLVVDEGDLTVEDFVNRFPDRFWGLNVELLFKYDLSQKDIDEGKGQLLYEAGEERSTASIENMLARPNLSERMKAQFEKQIADIRAYNTRRREKMSRKMKDLYVELYGPLASESRNYLLLGGAFKPKLSEEEEASGADYTAVVPVIKYVFKN